MGQTSTKRLPKSVAFLCLIPFWCCNCLVSCEPSHFAPYDGRVAWIGQYFLSALIVFLGYLSANRVSDRPYLRIFILLAGVVIWYGSTTILYSLTEIYGVKPLVEEQQRRVREWTGSDMPAGCSSNYESDSLYEVYWDCSIPKHDLFKFFRSRLDSSWLFEVEKDRFYRKDPFGKTTDEIRLYGSNRTCEIWISTSR